MYCNQCEQTAGGVGCVDSPGVCGKDADIQSLQELLLYGVKGMSAYAYHARRLGKVDEEVNAFIEKALFATMTNVNFDMESHLELVLECGKMNFRVMEMLDEGHIEKFGKPSPVTVQEGTQKGPGILVTGHDMMDLYELLRQTEGTGINVYTHGEMLPAHMYQELRKFDHLVGHFGGAWQKQRYEFHQFPGAILATTNCVINPRESYAERMFSTGVTSVAKGNVLNGDFTPVIEAARAAGALEENIVCESTIGFHRTVLADNLDAIVQAVKEGKVSRFFVIGGCDGAEAGRNYFSDYAEATPVDSFILTLGCGKYRIREHDYGTLLGFPRLLDMGQCNDAYGAIQVAVALSKEFDCSVNDLPLTLVISWFEQKAVAVLLTLLYLGVKGITIGPKPPAFVSPNVFAVLQEKYDLKLTSKEASSDLEAVLS